MKNVSAKVIILLLSLGSLQAQQEEATNFRFGIHGTPAISYINTTNTNAETSTKLKFGFGLLAQYYFADNYAFSTGITVMNRGGKMELRDTVGDYSSGFLQIPLMLKMQSRQFGYLTYFAEFGGSIDVGISEKVTFDPPVAFPLDSYVRPINLMFTIGLGTEYSLGGKTALVAGLYYNRSLIDNLNNNSQFVEKSENYRFDFVSLKVGVLF